MPEHSHPKVRRSLRLGVAGPVGTGKSSLIALLCRELGAELSLGVITNDIYTDEDARFLRSAGVLDPERIRAVETGACPHTAIRDDVTANLLAVEDLERDFAPLDVVLVESGGDNLTATFSPALVDAQFFVLDVAGGGDVARKGGPGIAGADLLVVNKTDLGPVRRRRRRRRWSPDAAAARDGRPVIALSRTDPSSIAGLRQWVLDTLADFRAGPLRPRDPGPMAPHVHADGVMHSHPGEAVHSHSGRDRRSRPLTVGPTVRVRRRVDDDDQAERRGAGRPAPGTQQRRAAARPASARARRPGPGRAGRPDRAAARR